MASKYWKIRKDFKYYKLIRKFVLDYMPDGGTLLDVGSGLHAGCEFLKTFPKKYDTTSFENCKSDFHIPGVKEIVGDVYADLKGKYDIVICSQMLEHLDYPQEACSRLLDLHPKLLILSVPYKWREGMEPGHVQDPVDERMLFQWTRYIPTESHIVMDKPLRRLVTLYDFR